MAAQNLVEVYTAKNFANILATQSQIDILAAH